MNNPGAPQGHLKLDAYIKERLQRLGEIAKDY